MGQFVQGSPEEGALLLLLLPLLEVSAGVGLVGDAVPRLRLGEADALHRSLGFLSSLIRLFFCFTRIRQYLLTRIGRALFLSH